MPSQPATLADLDGPQAPTIVAGIGAAVAAQLAEAPARGAALTGSTVLLDEHGAPHVGERGERLGSLDDSDQLCVAPEVWAGAQPSMASDLYGLGIVLYRLATGQPPRFNPERPGPPPPPSTLHPDLPAALDRAILSLLHEEPSRRHAALATLHDLAGELPDLRRLTKLGDAETAPVGVGTVKYTTTPATSATVARRAHAPARTILAVPASQAAALTPAERSAIAGRVGAPLSAVEGLIGAGRAVPVAAGLRRRDAIAADLPGDPVSPAGLPMLAAAVGLGAIGLVGLGVGLVTALVAVLVGLGMAAVALIPLIASVVCWVLWFRGRAEYLGAVSGWKALVDAAESSAAHPVTGEAWTRLAAVRATLAAADLPDAAEVDLRDGLRSVERELHRLGERWTATNEALSAAGSDERAALEARLATLRDEAARLEHSLEELAGLVGRATHAYDDDGALEGAMDRVLTAARLAAQAVSRG